MKTILMSIREDPFNAMVEGTKKHEFRRKFYVKEPCQVIFYVSSPVKAILGIGFFDKPICDSVEGLIEIIKQHNFSSPESLSSYMKGLNRGYALPVLKIKQIKPISLEYLRRNVEGFRPPQSYCEFKIDNFKNVLEKLDFYETPNEIIQNTLF